MKTILVPTDFSPAAVAAGQFAITLARIFNSNIVLLHVVEGVDEGSFNIEGEAVATGSWENKLFNLKVIEKARKQLAQASSIFVQSGVNVKSVLRMGDAFHGIRSIILEQKADLVVIGSEGTSGFGELLIGSNTEKVVRRSSVPVISVNQKSNVGSVNSIVWATALNNEDAELPAVLRKLMDIDGTVVHLVRVNTPALFISDSVAREKLNSFAKAMKLKNFTINVYNDYDEVDGIIRFAAGINADLIALSTHGRRGLSHLLNGSIAEDIVNYSRRPVMTYVVGR